LHEKEALRRGCWDDLTVGLAFHEVPASQLTEFAEKVAEPFYRGDIAAAIEDLMQQAIAEREFVLSPSNT
jgi:gamma-glutamyltranspeptidase